MNLLIVLSPTQMTFQFDVITIRYTYGTVVVFGFSTFDVSTKNSADF